MEQLQQVLTVGVDAFAQQLPQSVDGTLVQFDAVLAEGVLRINGSIERLREAMDDLIEQLSVDVPEDIPVVSTPSLLQQVSNRYLNRKERYVSLCLKKRVALKVQIETAQLRQWKQSQRCSS